MLQFTTASGKPYEFDADHWIKCADELRAIHAPLCKKYVDADAEFERLLEKTKELQRIKELPGHVELTPEQVALLNRESALKAALHIAAAKVKQACLAWSHPLFEAFQQLDSDLQVVTNARLRRERADHEERLTQITTDGVLIRERFMNRLAQERDLALKSYFTDKVREVEAEADAA